MNTTRQHVLCALALLLLAGGGARADLTLDMTYIGDAGSGGVDYNYYIGTYEVTVGQYTEFLNAKAASDPYGLYNGSMESGPLGPFIVRSGDEGCYNYSAATGKENQPIRIVSLYDAMRFVNWLGNGQGSGDTENGAYDLSLGIYATRQPGATWVIPSSEEWGKAAYYDAMNNLYYEYPNGSDAVPQEPTDGTTPREMNFGDIPFWQGTVCFTSIGETTGHSPYGVYDMGGNVNEWTETYIDLPAFRLTRGGSFLSHEIALRASWGGNSCEPYIEGDGIGFRVAYIMPIPEPATCVLLLLGLPAVLAIERRRRRCCPN